jgi:hypothetical protein
MPRRGDVCFGCQHRFAAGEPLAAYLYGVGGIYERRDYCEHCQPATEPAPLAVWKTRRPEPTAKKVQAFDRDTIYKLFERLEEAHEDAQLQFRFVLALLLWRKRILKLERTVAVEGREAWEFVAAHSGAAHRVVHPEMSEDELERLSTQLEQLLAGQPGELEILSGGSQPEESDA